MQFDVRATRAVSRGEELLRISGDAVATAADLGAYAAGRDAVATDDDAELREIAALALLIQESRRERARSGMCDTTHSTQPAYTCIRFGVQNKTREFRCGCMHDPPRPQT